MRGSQFGGGAGLLHEGSMDEMYIRCQYDRLLITRRLCEAKRCRKSRAMTDSFLRQIMWRGQYAYSSSCA
jgi:hypothetical protein